MADIEVSDDAVVAEALTHRGELVGEDVAADDASAGLGQPQRDRPTLAPGCAGHHGDLVVELPHRLSRGAGRAATRSASLNGRSASPLPGRQ